MSAEDEFQDYKLSSRDTRVIVANAENDLQDVEYMDVDEVEWDLNAEYDDAKAREMECVSEDAVQSVKSRAKSLDSIPGSSASLRKIHDVHMIQSHENPEIIAASKSLEQKGAQLELEVGEPQTGGIKKSKTTQICVVPDPDLSEKNDHLLDFPQIDHTTVSLEPTLESEDLFTSEYFWNYVADPDDEQTSSPFVEYISTSGDAEVEEEEEKEEFHEDQAEEGPQGGNISDNDLLYPGASISVMESVTSVLSFAQSEHLSGVGLSRLLALINLHLPQPNNFLKTNHRLFKTLEGVDEPVHVHHFCSVCYKVCQTSTDLCDTCTDENRHVEYFLTFPVVPQLQKMYKRSDFMQNLQYKKTRVKKNPNNIEDIFDGEMYKEAENLMTNPNGITFTFNTDGVQIFKSNTYSLWPVYLVINELPPEKRFLSENLIIVGLWGSLLKPHPNLYLLPIYKELAPLKTGVAIQVYGEDEPLQISAKVTCATCDAPATALFMNMKYHSGFYSCPVCLSKGEKPGDATIFPYEENVPLRSLEQYKENVRLAVRDKVIFMKTIRNPELYHGIKGPTILSHIFDNFFSSIAIDGMHSLYIGQMKQMLRLWFDEDFKKAKFSVHDKLAIVTQRLLDLEPPHFLQRLPQALQKLVHWKASEFRSFLFNLSIILLHDVLKPEYFNHFSLFVQGVSLLNSSSISEDDLLLSDNYLKQFVKDFEQLYEVDHMSHNLHMCLHLAHCVRLHGPLWAFSCFQFEDINGRLTNMIHGTRHVSLQIYSNLSVITQLPLMVNNLNEGIAKEYCVNMKKKSRINISDVISPGLYCVGSFAPVNVESAWVVDILKNRAVSSSQNVQLFQRLIKNGLLFMSALYKKGKRNSSYCKYKTIDGILKYGNIKSFIKVSCKCTSHCSCHTEYLALVKPIPVQSFNVRHVFECDAINVVNTGFNIDIVCLQDLDTVMFMIKCAGKKYLVEPLNKFEME